MPTIIQIGAKIELKSLKDSQYYSQNLTKAFEDYKSCDDVTLHCQGKVQVKTNKIALFFSSKLFKKIFETNCDCNTNALQEYDILCPEVNPDAMSKVLELINYGTTTLSSDNVELRTEMILIIQSFQININQEPAIGDNISNKSHNIEDDADKIKLTLQQISKMSKKYEVPSQIMTEKFNKIQLTSQKIAETCDEIGMMAEVGDLIKESELVELQQRFTEIPKSVIDSEMDEVITKLTMSYSCNYCDLKFHLSSGLKEHLKTHLNKSKLYESASLIEQKQTDNDQQEMVDFDIQDAENIANSILCPFCDQCFTNFISYDEHVTNHSDGSSSNGGHFNIKIDMTDKTETMWSETADQDLTFGTEKKSDSVSFVSIKCPLCKARKNSFENLLVHMAFHHYKKEIYKHYDRTQRKCQMCEKKFTTHRCLVRHMLSVKHNLLNKIITKEMVETLKHLAAEYDNKKAANDGKKIRKRKLIFNIDEDKLDGINSDEDIQGDETSTSSQSDLEDSSMNEVSYKCSFCPQIETHYTHLLNHVATAHFADELCIEKSQKQCYFCGKSFTTSKNLACHIVQKHQFLKLILSEDDWQKLDKESCKVQRSMDTTPLKFIKGEEDEAEKLWEIKSLNSTSENRLNTIFRCPICKCRKPSFSNLKVHIGMVHCKEEVRKMINKDTLGCNLCQSTFKKIHYVESHLVRKHQLLSQILPSELLKKLEDMNRKRHFQFW